ncbi:7170_t:CDS:2 [Acaulospora morrowiae]|uniref:7170_t:CDS:1 n=1 Tax=Acaulospora morrowiae TaxID=94023 RepID=A0A9N8ZAZ5_9GLOM|nr:7170_t:CDS:2 [Acaulospora morrowiae]
MLTVCHQQNRALTYFQIALDRVVGDGPVRHSQEQGKKKTHSNSSREIGSELNLEVIDTSLDLLDELLFDLYYTPDAGKKTDRNTPFEDQLDIFLLVELACFRSVHFR